MSQHALDRFIKRLSSDNALQDQLVEFGMRQGLAPGRGRLSEQAIVEFAVQQGFELSLDEVRGGNLSRELPAQPTAPLTT